MAQFSDVTGRLDAIDAAITTEKQQYIDQINNLNSQLATANQTIATLQAQLANVITSDQADAIVSRLDNATTEVGNIVP